MVVNTKKRSLVVESGDLVSHLLYTGDMFGEVYGQVKVVVAAIAQPMEAGVSGGTAEAVFEEERPCPVAFCWRCCRSCRSHDVFCLLSTGIIDAEIDTRCSKMGTHG